MEAIGDGGVALKALVFYWLFSMLRVRKPALMH
jgi:hypothetical protein